MSPKARPPVEPAVPTYRPSGLKARVPVDPGPQGSQGVIGPVGPAGLGLPGVDGEDGVDGWMGPRGLTGATGAGLSQEFDPVFIDGGVPNGRSSFGYNVLDGGAP